MNGSNHHHGSESTSSGTYDNSFGTGLSVEQKRRFPRSCSPFFPECKRGSKPYVSGRVRTWPKRGSYILDRGFGSPPPLGWPQVRSTPGLGESHGNGDGMRLFWMPRLILTGEKSSGYQVDSP